MLIFKIADTEEEFEQIFCLNYETFAAEIPQHETNESKKLIDKFHYENTYFICKKNDELIAMIAYRDKRPFSLDHKLPNLDSYLPISKAKPCELRLLSIKKEYRGSRIFAKIATELMSHVLSQNCDIALISGTTQQERLYKHVGFVPFASLIGNECAKFQPMFITKETIRILK
jgi:hypothetical protein